MFELLFKRKHSPQYELRIALTKIIKIRELYSFPVLAELIKVDRETLIRFLKEERDVEFMTLVKIVDFIENNKDLLSNNLQYLPKENK